MTNVLAHTHGIGTIDFSTMHPEELEHVQKHAERKNVLLAPSVFLTRDYMARFGLVLRYYSANRDRLDRILGFSIEGPLLGSEGGVPSRGVWSPTLEEWKQICMFGPMGLRYMVIAPDRCSLDMRLDGLEYRAIFEMLYKHGVKAALGHFRHDNPRLSADRLLSVITHIRNITSANGANILTDHLFNDMPRMFKHAWRTPAELGGREAEIKRVTEANWDSVELDELLGPVPAEILRAGRRGELLPFLNFDGVHVDMEICKKAVGFTGIENIVGITDDTSVPHMAGENLEGQGDGGLWRRSDGIVAAGSSGIEKQLLNMTNAGFDSLAKKALFVDNALRALAPVDGMPGVRWDA